MRIIKKGDPSIMRLWGYQNIKPTLYRLMKYVVCEKPGFLYNVVSGELVLLSEQEQQLISDETIKSSDILHELIRHHFLVPLKYDEYADVVGIRKVSRLLEPKSKFITNYTILPTTSCNARCYYCIEHGSKIVTMSEETASGVVEYIKEHCGNENIVINWYGGEPTVAHQRISQICNGLSSYGIYFESTMITNGYLFNERLVKEAVNVWHMKSIRFSFDGSRDNYNRIKNYVNACDDPYKKVISSIGRFLEEKIDVHVRMNFDLINADDFQNLLSDLQNIYGKNEHLKVYASPIYGEYTNHTHGTSKWLEDQQRNLNDMSLRKGLSSFKSDYLPHMLIWGCMAENPASIVITPEGNLTRCMCKFDDEDTVGNIYAGIVDNEKYHSWENIRLPEICSNCAFVPLCIKYPNCPGFNDCFHKYRNYRILCNIQELTKNGL